MDAGWPMKWQYITRKVVFILNLIGKYSHVLQYLTLKRIFYSCLDDQFPEQNRTLPEKLLYSLTVCLNVMYAFVFNDYNFSESLIRCKKYAQWKSLL